MSTRFVTCWIIGVLLLAARFGPARAQEPAGKKARRPQAKLVQKTYMVADLVVPIASTPQPSGPCQAKPAAAKTSPASTEPQLFDPQTDRSPGRQPTIEDTLIATIKNSVAPSSWSDKGGRGTADYFPLGMALVINQTPAIHKQIGELLAALRRLQDTEVVVEVRLMTLSDSLCERIAKDLNVCLGGVPGQLAIQACPAQAGGCPKVAFLNDQQVRKVLESAQGDRRSNIIQAPKMTVFNGQTAALNIADQPHLITGTNVARQQGQPAAVTPVNESLTTGLQMSVQPVVSADRRYVRMNLKLNLTRPTSPAVSVRACPPPAAGGNAEAIPCKQCIQQTHLSRLAIDKAFSVPVGNTVIFGGWKEKATAPKQACFDVVSWIPYVGCLFGNTEAVCESDNVMVMVTPRIIIHEEEETRQTGYIAPAAEESEPPTPTKQPVGKEQKLAKLMERYDRACREGRRDEARKLALEALVLDPMCFGKRDSAGQ